MDKISQMIRVFVIFITTGLLTSLAFGNALNGTGVTGQKGIDGTSYSRTARKNPRKNVKDRSQCETTPGKHGTPGLSGGVGGRGADYNLTISDVGHILIMGSKTDYSSGIANTVDINENFRVNSVVQIVSDGGRGGLPGKGGDGEGAQEGQDSDQVSDDEDKDGQKGCDAGLPGNGEASGPPGDGGDAGNITIRLAKEEAHLLFAISTSAIGGAPGERLRGGYAGDSASGGEGGEGYYDDRSGNYPTGRMIDKPPCVSKPRRQEWTGDYVDEPGCTPRPSQPRPCKWVTQTTDATQAGTCVPQPDIPAVTCRRVQEMEWKSAIDCEKIPEMEYRTVIVRTDKGKRGGSPSGKDGASSPNTAGPGEDGEVVYEIVDSNGSIQRFHSANLIDLSMVDYDLVEEDPNGVFEPGETVKVMNLRIRNRGPIDYEFSKAETMVSLRNSTWLSANPQQLKIPRIAAGETITIEDPDLEFTIRVNRFEVGARSPRWEDTIVPFNQITRINRSWNGLSLERQIPIVFPVRLTSFQVPENIELGQTVKISWTIENLANRAIPNVGEYARDVETEIEMQSRSLFPHQLSLEINGNSRGTIDEGLIEMISDLGPREIRKIEGSLSVHPNAEPYSTATLGVTLRINKLHEKSLSDIQRMHNEIRVTKVYRTRSEDDVLLVLTESNQDLYRAWMSFFTDLGLQANIWDLSVDGGFSFFGALESGGNLSQDFSNKTLVFPKIFNQGATHSYLRSAHRDLYEAAKSNKNNLYLIGYQTSDFQSLLEKSLGEPNRVDHKSFEEFEQSFSTFPGNEEIHFIGVEEGYFFNRFPRMNKMFVVKEQIENWLKEKFPEENYLVSADYRPKSLGGLIKANYFLGHIIVRKALEYDNSKLVLLPTSQNIFSRSFVTSKDNTLALCLSLNQNAKLKALRASAEKSAHTLKSILNCIQYDAYQDWMADKDLEKTQVYASALKEIYASGNQAIREQILQATAIMQVMAMDGVEKESIVESLQSDLIRSYSDSDKKKLELMVNRVRAKIEQSTKVTSSTPSTMTKASILKVINPRSQTTGIDASDINL